MTKKKSEKEIKAEERRTKREKRTTMGEGEDDFGQLNSQLAALGLTLKQVPGDGNCLFRALGDQLEGSVANHLGHREDVVHYMQQHREDFEPFVEDDISFDQHLRHLAQPGVFAGNDSIVAFARLQNLTVVIHQLNKPLWQIHGGPGGTPGQREAHISYHNGDHYNSVRRIGDLNARTPSRIKLASLCSPQQRAPAPNNRDRNSGSCYSSSDSGAGLSDDSGAESDYENAPSGRQLDQLTREVSRLSGVESKKEVLSALESTNYVVKLAVERLRQSRRGGGGIWADSGTGTRILATQADMSSGPSIQNLKPQAHRNIGNKRQKKRQQKLEKEERRRAEAVREVEPQPDLIITNLKTLTI